LPVSDSLTDCNALSGKPLEKTPERAARSKAFRMRCEVSENLKILAHGSSNGFSNEKSASVYECGRFDLDV
jgi:hypothetical protein